MSSIRDIINAATPGPWYQDGGEEGGYIFVGNRLEGETNGLWQLVHMSSEKMDELNEEARTRHLANARYITEMNPTHIALMEAVIPTSPYNYEHSPQYLYCEYCLVGERDYHKEDCAWVKLYNYRNERDLDG